MNRTLPAIHTDSRKSPRRLPIPVLVIYLLALLTGGIHVAAVFLPSFADWFNRYIGAAVRGALSYLTVWIPFSFAELLLFSLPIIFVVMLRRALTHYGDSWKSVLRYCAGLLALLLCFYILFVWGFGTGYHGSTLEEKLDLDRQPVSAEELEETARWLVERIKIEQDEIAYRPDGFSVMPYSHSGMNKQLMKAYDTVCENMTLSPTCTAASSR
ncbi:MAG: DUF3810 family protein [Clostridia bacterium]|nr:DUF3810 family protein [Clostridia bacterium]